MQELENQNKVIEMARPEIPAGVPKRREVPITPSPIKIPNIPTKIPADPVQVPREPVPAGR